jgi:hypothetical protein
LVALGEDNKSINAQATCTVQPTASADAGEGDGTKTEESTGTAEPTSKDSNSNSNNQSSEGKEDDEGLSTGAVIGIAVGICGPVIAGVAFLIWFLMRRKQKKKEEEAEKRHLESTAVYMTYPSPPETPKIGWPTQGVPHFIPQEMATDNQPKIRPVELPT